MKQIKLLVEIPKEMTSEAIEREFGWLEASRIRLIQIIDVMQEYKGYLIKDGAIIDVTSVNAKNEAEAEDIIFDVFTESNNFEITRDMISIQLN